MLKSRSRSSKRASSRPKARAQKLLIPSENAYVRRTHEALQTLQRAKSHAEQQTCYQQAHALATQAQQHFPRSTNPQLHHVYFLVTGQPFQPYQKVAQLKPFVDAGHLVLQTHRPRQPHVMLQQQLERRLGLDADHPPQQIVTHPERTAVLRDLPRQMCASCRQHVLPWLAARLLETVVMELKRWLHRMAQHKFLPREDHARLVHMILTQTQTWNHKFQTEAVTLEDVIHAFQFLVQIVNETNHATLLAKIQQNDTRA